MKKDFVQSKTGLGHKASKKSNGSQANIDEPPSLPPHNRSKSPKRHYMRWFFWSAAFVLTATISASLGATLALLTPLSPFLAPIQGLGAKNNLWSRGFQYKIARPINILVMGIDRVPNAPKNSREVFAGRSDTMLLLRLDPRDNTVKMLSIPRDTQVEVPGVGVDKINDANVEGGPAMAARVVSRTLNDVPIDRYVRVTTEAFRELVDIVGGIDVYVPYPMQYVDNTQNLNIDLAQGWQTLNGDQAEQFARFRKDQFGDIGRVQRQQTLLKALRQRISNPTVLPRLAQAVRVMQQYIDTNLSLEEMLALVGFGLKIEPENFKMVLLPGRFSTPNESVASYWIMDSAGKDRIIREYFQLNSTLTSLEVENDSATQVRIAIQNSTQNPELAYRMVEYLAEKNFHNVYVISDWPDRLRQTQIIDQQGDQKAAGILKKILGVGKVEASSTGDLDSDVTIRLGEDWLNKQF
ncbi:MAG: LCP family protein [Coleofasciculaceae cyanobacterium]